MSPALASMKRSVIAKLLLATGMLLGFLALLAALAGGVSAGGDAVVTVNSTANIDDGDCEGPPNNDALGNCTLREAINLVNDGDADVIRFHPPVFSKEQPGVIELCNNDGNLPTIERDLIIDSIDTGVVLDGGSKSVDCTSIAAWEGLTAVAQSNGLDFSLKGGKNFEVKNFNCEISDNHGIGVLGGVSGFSLGTIEITGVIIDNVCGEGINVRASNLESLSITNSEVSSNSDHGIAVLVEGCAGDPDCTLDDSVVSINGNRIQGGITFAGTGGDGQAAAVPASDGVHVEYLGVLNSKVTVAISENEIINGFFNGVDVLFSGCGTESGVNVHVDENDEINTILGDGVSVGVLADACSEPPPGAASVVGTTDEFEAIVTINGNGDIESQEEFSDAISVDVLTCCAESDSSGAVEVNDNGRISGEGYGVDVHTAICCGDDNSSSVDVSRNDEITGESGYGVFLDTFAGSDGLFIAGTDGSGLDADDNTCVINVDGNSEIDGVGTDGVRADCFAGTLGYYFGGGGELSPGVAGPPLSSGDGNTSSISITNNEEINGNFNGVFAQSVSGSADGEADENSSEAMVSGNGEITGDDSHGVNLNVAAGAPFDEGDDNNTNIVVSDNAAIAGNGLNGLDLDTIAGGVTAGSERNATSLTVEQNGTIEGAGDMGGVVIDSVVCCDPSNTNDIAIINNKGNITGYDANGIDIETCCSANTVTITDNEGNIRGGDGDGLEMGVCGIDGGFTFPVDPAGGEAATAPGFSLPEYVDCLEHSVTNLLIDNNSFSDSGEDGISIEPGIFQDEELDIKSVISNNVIEGNGDDGIDVESASGLNIGPANEIFLNGNTAGDNGIEVDWCFGGTVWDDPGGIKFLANSNHITQNSIYDNYGLGIDLVGWLPGEVDGCTPRLSLEDEGTVGCVPYGETAISPNDCIPFPQLKTQSDNKLVGMACSLCDVEIFIADDTPDNNEHHGEGVEYLVSTQADEDGNWSVELPCDLGPGDLTATATDKLKNTSEFSENLSTLGTFCPTDTPTPTNTPVPPTNTPVAPTSTPAPKQCGDVNDDGVTNSIDATLVLQLKAQLVDSLPNEASGDVNGDGDLTSIDAALILQYTAALIGDGDLNCP